MSEEQSKKKQECIKKEIDSNEKSQNEIKRLEHSNNSENSELVSEEADIVQDLGDEFENSEKFAKVVAKVITQEFSGPIPSPNTIAGYEKVLPGAADRIISMAEKQSSHRQEIQMMETKAENRDSLLGVVFAFGLGIGCLVACIVMVIMVPKETGAICGSILGVTGIGSIVAAFLKNTRPSKK